MTAANPDPPERLKWSLILMVKRSSGFSRDCMKVRERQHSNQNRTSVVIAHTNPGTVGAALAAMVWRIVSVYRD